MRIPRTAVRVVTVAFVLASCMCIGADDGSSLDRLKNHDQSIIINFKDTNVSAILGVVASAGSFKLNLGESFHDSMITVQEQNTTIKGILVHLAQERHLSYSVPDPENLVVESIGQ